MSKMTVAQGRCHFYRRKVKFAIKLELLEHLEHRCLSPTNHLGFNCLQFELSLTQIRVEFGNDS